MDETNWRFISLIEGAMLQRGVTPFSSNLSKSNHVLKMTCIINFYISNMQPFSKYRRHFFYTFTREKKFRSENPSTRISRLIWIETTFRIPLYGYIDDDVNDCDFSLWNRYDAYMYILKDVLGETHACVYIYTHAVSTISSVKVQRCIYVLYVFR